MIYSSCYKSPVGKITLVSDKENLIGLWMEGQKYFGSTIGNDIEEKDDLDILCESKDWLNEYFSGNRPRISDIPLAPQGSDFRQEVWRILIDIPYGKVKTYGDIAKEIELRTGKERMSCQAVGGAVGHNPISIIIPCHRVVGTNGSLTGYAGGIDKKIKLLEHEGVDMSGMFIPKEGTAL